MFTFRWYPFNSQRSLWLGICRCWCDFVPSSTYHNNFATQTVANCRRNSSWIEWVFMLVYEWVSENKGMNKKAKFADWLFDLWLAHFARCLPTTKHTHIFRWRNMSWKKSEGADLINLNPWLKQWLNKSLCSDGMDCIYLCKFSCHFHLFIGIHTWLKIDLQCHKHVDFIFRMHQFYMSILMNEFRNGEYKNEIKTESCLYTPTRKS